MHERKRGAGQSRYRGYQRASSGTVEIGSTWYAKRVQRTPLNTERKRMLLACLRGARLHLGGITGFFNHPSRATTQAAAIERLGAKLDGILRSHMRYANGTLRDTCVYSIITAEWPAVNAHLDFQLERAR